MVDDNDIEQLGKGAELDPYDYRDYTAEVHFGVGEPVEWKTTPLGRPEPVDFNQRSSNSCVGCATRNLHWLINPKDFSRRDIYSRIFLPGPGGAYLRDGVKVVCDIGNQTQDECPDPAYPTEALMRQKSELPDSAGSDDKQLGYFVLKSNTIDAVAQAIRDYGGCIMGVVGSNQGWQDKTNPRPPKSGEGTWQHAIAAFDFCLKNGKKTIIAKSSWCSGSHHIHYINEDYFTSGNTFNAWCLIPKENIVATNSILIKRMVGNNNGTPIYEYGFYDPATSADGLISIMRNRGITPPLKPDKTLDWERVEQMVGGIITPNK
jgi:hypothetical protein